MQNSSHEHMPQAIRGDYIWSAWDCLRIATNIYFHGRPAAIVRWLLGHEGRRGDTAASSLNPRTDESDLQKSRLDRSPTLPSVGSPQHPDSPELERQTQTIANIVILVGLSLASDDVQIQALEVSDFLLARCMC